MKKHHVIAVLLTVMLLGIFLPGSASEVFATSGSNSLQGGLYYGNGLYLLVTPDSETGVITELAQPYGTPDGWIVFEELDYLGILEERNSSYEVYYDSDTTLEVSFTSNGMKISGDEKYKGNYFIISEYDGNQSLLTCTYDYDYIRVRMCTSDSFTDGQIFPDSDRRIITEDEYMQLEPWELKLAVQELYARVGYRFKSADLLNYYENQPWYNPVYDKDTEAAEKFNWYEKQNVDAMGHYFNANKNSFGTIVIPVEASNP